MMKTLIAVQKYRCPWNTHSRCQHWSSEPDSVPLHVMGDDLHIDGFGLQNKDDLCSVYWKAWRLWKKAFFCRAKCFTDLREAACISSSCYFYPLPSTSHRSALRLFSVVRPQSSSGPSAAVCQSPWTWWSLQRARHSVSQHKIITAMCCVSMFQTEADRCVFTL